MDFRAEVTGGDKLALALSRIPRGVKRRLVMPALRAGGEVVRKDAESNLSRVADKGYSTGVGLRNIRVYNARKYRGSYRVVVMVRRGAMNSRKIVNGQPVRVGLYLSVLEYGKRNQPPRSWIRKAIQESQAQATEQVRRVIYGGIDRVVVEARR